MFKYNFRCEKEDYNKEILQTHIAITQASMKQTLENYKSTVSAPFLIYGLKIVSYDRS